MINRLALSCFGLRSPCLNLVSHGDQMNAPRKQMALCTQKSLYVTKCALLAYRSHVFQQILLEQLLVDNVTKSARGPAVDTLSATCMSLVEMGSSRVRSSFCLAHCLASSLQTSSFFLLKSGCRRCGATYISSCCVVCHLFDKHVAGPRICAKFQSQWWQLSNDGENVRVCKHGMPTKKHEFTTMKTGRCERCARSVRMALVSWT